MIILLLLLFFNIATENETERKLIEDEINGIEIELSMEENIRKQQRWKKIYLVTSFSFFLSFFLSL